MEAVETALFENPTAIYVILGFFAVVGLINFGFKGTARSACLVYIAILAGAAVWGISTWVVTDREQIRAACGQIAEAVPKGDMSAFEQFLDAEFVGPRERSRKQAIDWLTKQMKETAVTSVRYRMLELEIDAGRAETQIRTDIVTNPPPGVRMEWEATWIKRPDGWRILKAAGR